MADITASMVKELREKSGAGMMDAKKALVENNGDMEQAVDWLRSKGLAKASKKSGRTAAEGLVAVAVSDDQTKAVLLEINAETDFVARNEKFQEFVKNVATLALEGATDLEALAQMSYQGGDSVSDTLTNLIATIGENMGLRRMQTVSVSEGVIASYVHNSTAPGLGQIGVLVALESAGDKAVLAGVGKQIAMHVAATKPEALSVDTVDQGAADRERAVLKEQAMESGKTEEIATKMVEGRMRKYYEDVVLLEQTFVMDGETKISDVVANASKDAGALVQMNDFAYYVLGEGIEKEEEDFAAEVARTANG